MFKILWLDSAVNDLARLRVFIAEVNPNAASKAANIIKGATDNLQEFPLIGRPVEELEDFYDLFIEFGASGYHLRYKLFNEKSAIVFISKSKSKGCLNTDKFI